MAQRSSAANEVAPLNLQKKPTLSMLINMPTQSGDKIRVIEGIGAEYTPLGAMLLDDDTGAKTEGIVAAHPQQPAYHIIASWLKGGGREPVIWATLIDVLKEAGLKQLAQDIEKQANPAQHVHIPPSPAENEPSARAQPLLTAAVPGSAASPLPQGSQQSVGPSPNAGQVQEQQERESVGESDLIRSSDEVKKKIRALKKGFNELTITISECLETHKVIVKKVAYVLTQLSPDDDEHHRMFLESHVKQLDEAANHSQLFLTMNSHWNYLDPSLLDHMVNELELDDVKEEMEAYEEDLQKFRKKTPLALFCETQKKKKKELPQGFNEVVAKFNRTSDVDVTLEIVEQFRQEYASHYSVHEFAMMLAQFRPGSFIITLFIPESIIEKLKESDNVPRDILEKYSVIKLKVAGTIIYSDQEEEEDEPIDVQSSNDPVCSRPESEATASSSEESEESSDEETPHSEDASAPKTTPNAPSKNTATKQAQSEVRGEEEISHFPSPTATPKQDTSATAALEDMIRDDPPTVEDAKNPTKDPLMQAADMTSMDLGSLLSDLVAAKKRMREKKATDTDRKIVTEDIKDLMNLLSGIRKEDVLVFGTFLGVPESQLEHIELNYADNHQRFLTEVIMAWINACPHSSTWSTLVEALTEVGRRKTAQEVAEKRGIVLPGVFDDGQLWGVLKALIPINEGGDLVTLLDETEKLRKDVKTKDALLLETEDRLEEVNSERDQFEMRYYDALQELNEQKILLDKEKSKAQKTLREEAELRKLRAERAFKEEIDAEEKHRGNVEECYQKLRTITPQPLSPDMDPFLQEFSRTATISISRPTHYHQHHQQQQQQQIYQPAPQPYQHGPLPYQQQQPGSQNNHRAIRRQLTWEPYSQTLPNPRRLHTQVQHPPMDTHQYMYGGQATPHFNSYQDYRWSQYRTGGGQPAFNPPPTAWNTSLPRMRGLTHTNSGVTAVSIFAAQRQQLEDLHRHQHSQIKHLSYMRQTVENRQHQLGHLRMEVSAIPSQRHISELEEVIQTLDIDLCEARNSLQVQAVQSKMKEEQDMYTDEGVKWYCEDCSFLNHPLMTLCEKCDIPRTRSAS